MSYQPEEKYSAYVQEIRDRKQAEINERSLYSKAKRYFRRDYPEDVPEDIIIEAAPEVIPDDVIEEIEEPQARRITQAQAHEIARNEIQKSEREIRKEQKKAVQKAYDESFETARERRDEQRQLEKIKKAKESGKYYGSTDVFERTGHRAAKVLSAAGSVAQATHKVAKAGINVIADSQLPSAGRSVKRAHKAVGNHVRRLPAAKAAKPRKAASVNARRGSPSSSKGSPSSGRSGNPFGKKSVGSINTRSTGSINGRSSGFLNKKGSPLT